TQHVSTNATKIEGLGAVQGLPEPRPAPPPGSQPGPWWRQRRRLRPVAQEPPVVLNSALKMADHAFAGTSGNTSLRGLRERLVVMAQELAEERRRRRGINSSAVTIRRSSCIPANKEKQLLEKEQKAKLQYEKQLEERHRKLREQKEKDERRRVSAEEKRKQKQAEDKEKFKAVVSRTMERINRVDKQKRWSWEGRKTESKRSSSLHRKDNQLHPNVDHVDNKPGMTKYVFRYVTVPMFTSDELKSSMMFCKSSIKIPVPPKLEVTPMKKVETPLKEDVERPAKVNAETSPKMNMKAPSQANLDRPSEADVEIALYNMKDISEDKVEDISEDKVDISPKLNMEVLADMNSTRHPESNIEELPTVSEDASSSVGPSPIVSEDSSPAMSTGSSSSFVSVEISPIVSMYASLEESVDTSPELSMGSVSAVTSEGNLQTSFKNNGELNLEASVEAQPKMNYEASPKSPEVDKRYINLTTMKQLPSHLPHHRWSSFSTFGWLPPSPMKAEENQKIRPPSPLPGSSRLLTKTSLSYKVTPVQNIMYVPNALSTMTKKKEIIQKHMSNTDSGNKSVPSSESAMKVSVETHHVAFEEKGKKENEGVQKETNQSVAKKSESMAERVDEVPAEEFSPHKDEQQEKDLTKRHFKPPEEQKEQLQKGNNTMMKFQDSFETRKKEQERIMLQDLQERLERKKASEIPSNCPSEEDEADDEGETESDGDSLETFPSGMKTSLTRFKKFRKNAKRRPQKLMLLQAGSGEVDREKKIYFNGNMKAAKQNDPLDSPTQANGIKMPTKKPPNGTARTRKTREANSTVRSSLSVTTNQDWVCHKIIDLSHIIESPVIKTTAGSSKENLKDSMTTHQDPQAPFDNKKRGKPVSAPLTKALSNIHLAGRSTNPENPFACGCSRMAFGGKEEDSVSQQETCAQSTRMWLERAGDEDHSTWIPCSREPKGKEVSRNLDSFSSGLFWDALPACATLSKEAGGGKPVLLVKDDNTSHSPQDPAKLLRESSKNHKERDFAVFLNTDKEQTTLLEGIQLVTLLKCHTLVDDSPMPAQLPL
ncbi:hypothetical protein A6R68_02673, partial [Neotoma lepida]